MNNTDLSFFTLPRFNEIPNVGLYLKQVVTFISSATEPLLHTGVTDTMLSNYVKLHLVSSPEKKMYSRAQIAELLIIVLVKNVLSLDNTREFLTLQQSASSTAEAYDYFCAKFEAMLRKVSGREQTVFGDEELPADKFLLKQVIITLVQKIYMDECFLSMSKSVPPRQD